MSNNKNNYILGISAFNDGSAAALLRDGEIISAAEEERFSRKKNDSSFPARAIDYCLREAGISARDIDIVSFYERPLLKLLRILYTHIILSPRNPGSFLREIIRWMRNDLMLKRYLKIKTGYTGRVLFSGHQYSHAASAFFPSCFDESAVIVIDSPGELSTASFGKGSGNAIDIHKEVMFPASIGTLYSAFTYYCGFKVNEGEYKLMGLASYGKPEYAEIILDKLIDLKEDGSFKLTREYFDLSESERIINGKFPSLFGRAPRRPEDPIEDFHKDMARSIQAVTEEIVRRLALHVHKLTGSSNLCMAGGVALNCVDNGRILREGPFKNIWIQPASSDAGGAIGTAFGVWYGYYGRERETVPGKDKQKASLLGPYFSDNEIEEYLISNNIKYEHIGRRNIPGVVSGLLNDQKIIGWFQGRMEFGPRALGARSIIADPRSWKMQSVLNSRVKFRETFRPFAPSIIYDKAEEFFGIEESPYMLFVSPMKKNGMKPDLSGPLFPAVTHVDNSSRVQTVSREDNELYYDLIRKFYENYGCPMVVNTSFNVKGEPIVCTPDDAYKCFMKTNIDYLVIGSFIVLEKEDNFAPLLKRQKKLCDRSVVNV